MSNARSPEVNVIVNGISIPGIIEVEVCTNNHLAANRYRLKASLKASGYAIWTGVPLLVEIQAGSNGAWQSLIYGEADQLDFDIGRGEVHVDGRDLTSRLIASRTIESFENRTASDVAELLAVRRGLVGAITSTSQIIGRDFQNGYSRTTLSQHGRATTEWDLLVGLAEYEGFDVWVDGQTLNFSPPSQVAAPVVLAPSDCLSVRSQRLLSLGGGIEVTVSSWDCRGQQAVLETATSTGVVEALRKYATIQPNLSAAAAQEEAQRLLRQMEQHERSVCIDMPGDLTMRPRATLTLINTGTDFDGDWTVTAVERRMSFDHGFTQTIEARMPTWTAS